MTSLRSPWRTMPRTGRLLRLRGRGCRSRRTCPGRSVNSPMGRTSRRCCRWGTCGSLKRRQTCPESADRCMQVGLNVTGVTSRPPCFHGGGPNTTTIRLPRFARRWDCVPERNGVGDGCTDEALYEPCVRFWQGDSSRRVRGNAPGRMRRLRRECDCRPG